MKAQLYVAQGIIAGRIHQTQDTIAVRALEAARAEARRERRRLRGL
ncbi:MULTISPECIES: hypothetical protein [unclassified Nocardioides]|nr:MULTISPECIES: hypothetical protein [unclassified Nocardioides]